ncbi:MAG: LptA/OstA family protein [Caulobacteraceae bacterium]
MKPTAAFIAAGALWLAFIATPAHAQLSEGGGPVSYSANTLEYFDSERRLVLVGDVDIVQNDARLRADRITMFFSESSGAGQGGGQQSGLGAGDIERMVAEGDVFYIRPQQDARGDRAVYDVAQDSVTFTGNVIVMSEENVIRGETLVLQIGSRRTTIRPQAGQRVRGVFVPREGARPAPGNRPQ